MIFDLIMVMLAVFFCYILLPNLLRNGTYNNNSRERERKKKAATYMYGPVFVSNIYAHCEYPVNS